MMDCCRELYSFFDNSPKRQSFMEIVIDAHSPDNKKRKLKNLCKTRWVERHATFETIFDLYEFIVITLDQICEPTDDDRYYPNGEIWSWDPKTKTLANGLDDHRQAVGSSRDCHALPQYPYRSGQSIQQVHGNSPKAHDVSFFAP